MKLQEITHNSAWICGEGYRAHARYNVSFATSYLFAQRRNIFQNLFRGYRDFLGKQKARGPPQARYDTVMKYNTRGGICAHAQGIRQGKQKVLAEILFKCIVADRAAFFNGDSGQRKGININLK